MRLAREFPINKNSNKNEYINYQGKCLLSIVYKFKASILVYLHHQVIPCHIFAYADEIGATHKFLATEKSKLK